MINLLYPSLIILLGHGGHLANIQANQTLRRKTPGAFLGAFVETWGHLASNAPRIFARRLVSGSALRLFAQSCALFLPLKMRLCHGVHCKRGLWSQTTSGPLHEALVELLYDV